MSGKTELWLWFVHLLWAIASPALCVGIVGSLKVDCSLQLSLYVDFLQECQ